MAKRTALVFGMVAVLVSLAGFAVALMSSVDDGPSAVGPTSDRAAQNPLPPSLEFSGAFAWIDGDKATVFFSITNTGGDDMLTDAESDFGKESQFFGRSVCNNDRGSAERRDSIAVAAMDWTILKPAGCRLELTDLTRELRPGESFELRLTFERAGVKTLTIRTGASPVRGP